jgi:hypothetical protein
MTQFCAKRVVRPAWIAALHVAGVRVESRLTHREKRTSHNASPHRLRRSRPTQLISEEPDTYYLTDHYVNYPYVLVRLAHIRQDALRDLLLMGWRFVSTTKGPEVRKRQRK